MDYGDGATMWSDPGINDEGFFKKTVCKEIDYRQIEIKFFWPLTEQISLDLDYKDCDTRESKGLIVSGATGITFAASPTWSTSIAPTLSVEPTNSIGTLSIGGVKVGMEKEPSWIQKVLYKLLGFDWKNK